jgi:hypothetical protein
MQPDKKQIEVLLMEYFRASYGEFPKGKVLPTESPDFLVKMKNAHQLGIELTRLNPANAMPATEAYKREVLFREELISGMKELFERSSELKLFVKILFSEKAGISPEREISVRAQVVNLIREGIKTKNTKHFFNLSIPKSQLPIGIKDVLIVYHPGLETSVWERSNNLGVSNNVLDDIRKAIHKKDEKLKLYRKQHLNYYWLLITTDRLRGIKGFNLQNKIQNSHFHSSFQHVFLFDLIKTKIYELV